MAITKSGTTRDTDGNPLTGSAAEHPVGTGVGAVVGGLAAGAATGSVAGPVGTVVGAAVGAVIGGLAGKGIAEAIDPAAEDLYWRDNYQSRPYVGTSTYDDFGPAYAYGVDAYPRLSDRSFDDAEPELSRDWSRARGTSSLGWDRAKHAARDAWMRLSDTVERAVPGDSDRDGK